MSDYCTQADLESLLPMVTIAATGTEPTSAEVTGYITDASAEIDAILAGRGYSLPIPLASISALAYLKVVCKNGVAATTMRAKFPTQADAGEPYEGRYQKSLGDIRSGRTMVPDAATDEGTIGEGFTTTSAGDAYVPVVTREMVF